MPSGNKNRTAFVIFTASLSGNLYKLIIAAAIAGA